MLNDWIGPPVLAVLEERTETTIGVALGDHLVALGDH